MILRAWHVWGILVLLASTLAISAKPIEVPVEPAVDGTATPVLTQDYFQVDAAKSKVTTARWHRETTPSKPGLPIAAAAFLKHVLIVISVCK